MATPFKYPYTCFRFKLEMQKAQEMAKDQIEAKQTEMESAMQSAKSKIENRIMTEKEFKHEVSDVNS